MDGCVFRNYGTAWTGFFLTQENLICSCFIFKANRKRWPLFLRDRHIFTWKLLEILNVFITLPLTQAFSKRKPVKTGTPFFGRMYRGAKRQISIQNCPVKSKTGSPKWVYHNEQSFTTNLVFWKSNFSIRTSYKQLI